MISIIDTGGEGGKTPSLYIKKNYVNDNMKKRKFNKPNEVTLAAMKDAKEGIG